MDSGSGTTAGVTLGASTSVAGVALLPNTGGNKPLTYIALSAIILGAMAVVFQLAVMAYRLSLRNR